MAAAGESLLDERGDLRGDLIVEFTRASAQLPVDDNVVRLDRLDTSYRALGGRYATVADVLAGRREQLLAEARQDIEDFARLTEVWPALIAASRAGGLDG
jgi:hypothetical protein